MINTRDEITNLLCSNSVGCELGVFEGEFSQQLLNSGKFNKLYLVDIFSGQASNFGKHYQDASVLHDIVINRFSNNSSVEVIKSDSITFLRSTNIKFDFIYIDTIHSYDFLIQELEAAHAIIKSGGYICGHDYCLTFDGVIKAVKEFVDRYGYSIVSTTENDYPSFIIKIDKK